MAIVTRSPLRSSLSLLAQGDPQIQADDDEQPAYAGRADGVVRDAPDRAGDAEPDASAGQREAEDVVTYRDASTTFSDVDVGPSPVS